MKRSLAFLVLIIIAFLAISYIPVTITRSIVVTYPIDKTMEQVVRPKLRAKWFEHEMQIIPINPASVAVLATDTKGHKKKMMISMSPDPDQPLHTIVTLKLKGTISEKLFPGGSSNADLMNSLDHLRDYMENTEKMYGFKIRKVLVTDTSFLFLSRVVPTVQKQEETKKIFDTLISYATNNNITYTGVRIFHTERIDRENTQLFASIGISSYVPDHPSDSMLVKHMPYQKNLLEAEFDGIYKNVDSVYRALEAYKEDRSLINMAIPYQKFLTPGYGFSDTQRVRINVYYPFY